VAIVGWVTHRFKKRIDPWILIIIFLGIGGLVGAGIGGGLGGGVGAVIGAIIGAILAFLMWLSDVLTGSKGNP
jgi:hypothetical protein